MPLSCYLYVIQPIYMHILIFDKQPKTPGLQRWFGDDNSCNAQVKWLLIPALCLTGCISALCCPNDDDQEIENWKPNCILPMLSLPNMSVFEYRLSVNWKNSCDPSGLDGGGASPGPAPLNPISPPEASCSIHPIEVAPEAGLEPPATGAKPGGGDSICQLELPSHLLEQLPLHWSWSLSTVEKAAPLDGIV